MFSSDWIVISLLYSGTHLYMYMYIHCYHGSISVFSDYREIDIDDDSRGPVWLRWIKCPNTPQDCLGTCQTCPVVKFGCGYYNDITVQCSESLTSCLNCFNNLFTPQLVGEARQLGCPKIVMDHMHEYIQNLCAPQCLNKQLENLIIDFLHAGAV